MRSLVAKAIAALCLATLAACATHSPPPTHTAKQAQQQVVREHERGRAEQEGAENTAAATRGEPGATNEPPALQPSSTH